MWKPCGHLRGSQCNCAWIDRDRRRAIARLNAVIASENMAIERGNRRRRACIDKILEYAMLGNEKKARVWIVKLVSAGFDPDDGKYLERLSMKDLERECRRLLGVKCE